MFSGTPNSRVVSVRHPELAADTSLIRPTGLWLAFAPTHGRDLVANSPPGVTGYAADGAGLIVEFWYEIGLGLFAFSLAKPRWVVGVLNDEATPQQRLNVHTWSLIGYPG